MKYKILGDTGLKVSTICLGTMTFGEQNTEKEAHEQLSFALANGINFIDTAEMYAIPPRKETCLLYTSPSPRDRQKSRMPSSA